MTNQTSVSAFAPATVANLGPAFDILGLAIEEPGDTVKVTASNKPGVSLTDITGDQGKLPREVDKNTATVAVKQLLQKLSSSVGIELSLHKNMPLGSGLGSSAASTVAALVASNELLGTPLSRLELLPFAMEAERIACGVAHADNVAPALLGGIVLIRSYDPLDIISIPVPEELCCCVVHPTVEIRTEDARKILKKDIPLTKAVCQWGNVAGLISGLYSSDYQLISNSLADNIIEPERSLLIPGYNEVKQAAIAAGALGTSISGSGPAVFSLTVGEDSAVKVGNAKVSAFKQIGITAKAFCSKVNLQGAKIL